MDQMNANYGVIDLDLSDLEDADSIPRSPSVNKNFETQKEAAKEAAKLQTTRSISPPSPPPPPQPPPLSPPPETKRNPLQMFSTTRYNRTKEMLSDAGLGVNRVVAVAPTIPQNQYWMLPGAIGDD